ncbi:MAG: hypothetical protein ACYDA0_09700 [Candidatus Dormibacteraceae bacterium]
MRNLIRQPLTWMVIVECIIVALLIVVVWNVVVAASTQHSGMGLPQSFGAPTPAPTPPLPELTQEARPAVPAQLPGLNLDAGFWRLRLSQLNRDQVLFEQLEWRIVHNAMDAMQRYLETVVLPSITRAEQRQTV